MTSVRYLSEYEAKKLVCELSRLLAARGMLGGGQGSVSIRCAQDAAWITTAESLPEFMTADKLVRVVFRRQTPHWGRQPSPFTPSHTAAYLENENVMAVVTTAPPYLPVLIREESSLKGARVMPDGTCLIHWGDDPYKVYAEIRQIDDRFKRAYYEENYQLISSEPALQITPNERQEKEQIIKMITARVTELILTRLQQYKGGIS